MEAKKTEVITQKEVVTTIDVKTPMVTLTLTVDEAIKLRILMGGIGGDSLDTYTFGYSLRTRHAHMFPGNDLRMKLTSPLYNALGDVVGFD